MKDGYFISREVVRSRSKIVSRSSDEYESGSEDDGQAICSNARYSDRFTCDVEDYTETCGTDSSHSEYMYCYGRKNRLKNLNNFAVRCTVKSIEK